MSVEPSVGNVETPLARVGFLLAALFVATSSWTAVRVAGVSPSDLFLFAAIGAEIYSGRLLRLIGHEQVRAALMLMVPLVLLFTWDVAVLGVPITSPPARDPSIQASVGASVSGAGPFAYRLLVSTVVVGIMLASVLSVRPSARQALVTTWAAGISLSALAATPLGKPLAALVAPVLHPALSSSRAEGFASHPNSLAQAASLAVPIVLLAQNMEKSAKSRLPFRFLVASVLIFAVAVSGSRAGLIAITISSSGSLIVLALRSRGCRPLLPSLLLGCLVIGLVAGPVILSSTRFSDQSDAGQSNLLRLESLAQGVNYFERAPVLGVGLGSWNGENSFLVLLSGGGLLLLLAFLLWYARIFTLGWRHRGSRAQVTLVSAALLIFFLLNNGFVERYVYVPILLLGANAGKSLTAKRARGSSTIGQNSAA
jgi:O-antigen ligase